METIDVSRELPLEHPVVLAICTKSGIRISVGEDDRPSGQRLIELAGLTTLMTCAANSYARHYADPVAAAEADRLGECIAALQKVLRVLDCTDRFPGACETIRAALSGVKE